MPVLEERVDALEKRFVTYEEKDQSRYTLLRVINGHLQANTGNVEKLRRTLIDFQVETQVQFETVNSRLDQIETRQLYQNAELSEIKREVKSISSRLSVVEGDVATLKSDVATLKSDVATLKSDVAEIKRMLSQLIAQH